MKGSVSQVRTVCSVSGAFICRHHFIEFHTTGHDCNCKNYLNNRKLSRKKRKSGDASVAISTRVKSRARQAPYETPQRQRR